MLIRSSLTTQEQASVAATGHGSGRSALVIGGAGKLGRWFVDFLLSQGFTVEVSDPAGCPAAGKDIGDWRDNPLPQDFIVVATPLGMTDAVLRELALRRPSGVICSHAVSKLSADFVGQHVNRNRQCTKMRDISFWSVIKRSEGMLM